MISRSSNFLVSVIGAISFTLGIQICQAQALTTEFNPLRLATYTFPVTPLSSFQSTFGGSWQVMSELGVPSVAANLNNFTAYTFAAYSTGFSSGAVVSLVFVDEASCGAVSYNFPPKVHQVATMVVDQLDGNLYLHGSFGPDGWAPGACGYIEVTPLVPGP